MRFLKILKITKNVRQTRLKFKGKLFEAFLRAFNKISSETISINKSSLEGIYVVKLLETCTNLNSSNKFIRFFQSFKWNFVQNPKIPNNFTNYFHCSESARKAHSKLSENMCVLDKILNLWVPSTNVWQSKQRAFPMEIVRGQKL